MGRVSSKKSFGNSIIFLLISPVLTLIHAVGRTSINHRKWLFIFAMTILGSGMIFEVGDAVSHYERAQYSYSNMGLVEFLDNSWTLLTLGTVPGLNDEIYIHIVSFLSVSVFGHPPLFWLIVSFVYAFFFISSAFKVYYWYPTKNTTYLFILLFLVFIALKNIDGINYIRTWTGFWVLFYGLISYYETGNWRYLIFVFLLPPLIHVGFFVLSLPVWAAFFLNTQRRLIKFGAIGLFTISFFISIEQAWLLDPIMDFEAGQSKIQSYHREDAEQRQWLRTETVREGRLYATYENLKLHVFFIMLMAISMIVYGKYFRSFNFIESKLFTIGILGYAFSNVTTFIYAVSNRSALIATIFVIASIVLFVKRNYNPIFGINNIGKVHWMIIFILGILITPLFLFRLAEFFQWGSIYFFFLPFFAWFGEETNMTIREALLKLIS